MRWLRPVTLLVPGLLAAAAVGCGGGSSAPSAAGVPAAPGTPATPPKTEAAKPTPAPTAPARALKPATDLRTPQGLAEPMTETKMAKSGWSAYQDARPGDFTVYETPGVSRTRTEVFDVADHAVVLVMDVAVKIGDMETKSRTAGKYLLTEPDEPVDPVQKARYKTETKPVNRKFTVGGKEYTADTVREVSVEGMLSSRTWLSKELGEGVFLLMEDGDGKPLMRLVDYGRGR